MRVPEQVSGLDVLSSPALLTVLPAAVHAPTCTAASATAVATAGAAAPFLLQARDRFGNNRSAGGDAYAVTLDPAAGLQFAVSTSLQYLSAGLTSLSLVANRTAPPGAYVLRVRLAGVDISGSPFAVRVLPDVADPARCRNVTAVPHASAAGSAVAARLQASDRFGNDHSAGGEAFDVVVTGLVVFRTYAAGGLCDGPACVAVADLGTGQYNFSFLPLVSGGYLIQVLLLGRDGRVGPVGAPGSSSASPWRPCAGCPTLVVSPAALDMEQALAVGDGASAAVAGRQASFTLWTRDTYGNAQTAGGAAVQVRLQYAGGPGLGPGPAAVNAAVTDSCLTDTSKCGQYVVLYMLTVSGAYSMSAGLAAAGPGAGPANLSVTCSPDSSAAAATSGLVWVANGTAGCAKACASSTPCCLVGDGASFAPTGLETSFVLQVTAEPALGLAICCMWLAV